MTPADQTTTLGSETSDGSVAASPATPRGTAQSTSQITPQQLPDNSATSAAEQLDACWTRREFISGVAGAAASMGGAGILTSGCASSSGTSARRETRRKQIALLATEVRIHSHAQHFIDRFLEGYGWRGHWYHPSVDLVSLYVDQFPDK